MMRIVNIVLAAANFVLFIVTGSLLNFFITILMLFIIVLTWNTK